MEARIQVGLERAQSRALFAFGRAASPNQAKTGTDSYAIYQAPEADPSEANGATFRTVPSGGNRLPRVPLSANKKDHREQDIVERAKDQLTQGLSRSAPARVLATGRVSGNLISPARLPTGRMPTRVETLDNGLKVILRPIPDTRALSTWVVYRMGSRNEVPGMTGSTHWVEHMLFKGGGKPGKGAIDKMISRLGGKMNAFTDTDYTMYFETSPAAAMDTALMTESGRMRHARFDPEEVEAERAGGIRWGAGTAGRGPPRPGARGPAAPPAGGGPLPGGAPGGRPCARPPAAGRGRGARPPAVRGRGWAPGLAPPLPGARRRAPRDGRRRA